MKYRRIKYYLQSVDGSINKVFVGCHYATLAKKVIDFLKNDINDFNVVSIVNDEVIVTNCMKSTFLKSYMVYTYKHR